jgi:hypothetical protein
MGNVMVVVVMSFVMLAVVAVRHFMPTMLSTRLMRTTAAARMRAACTV